MGSSFRSLPFLLFGSFTNVVVVAGLGTVVAYSLAAAAAPPLPPSETQKGHLSWAGSLVCGSLSVRRLDGFPGLLDVLALAFPRSRSPIVCHLQQEQSSYSLERLFSSSFHKIGLPQPPSVCPPNVAPYLRGISPSAFFLLSVVARGEKVADSVRPSSRLSSVQQLFRWRMRRRLQLS